jgi:hypothetical protein
MPWATPSDVAFYTGITVGNDNVEAAQAIIELFSGTTEQASDTGNISSKNLRHLKMAVAFQAAWLTAHPDAYTNMDIHAMTEGSGGIAITLAHSQAHILAPLARVCLGRLSWFAARSIRVRPKNSCARQKIEARYRYLNEDDDCGNWEAL